MPNPTIIERIKAGELTTKQVMRETFCVTCRHRNCCATACPPLQGVVAMVDALIAREREACARVAEERAWLCRNKREECRTKNDKGFFVFWNGGEGSSAEIARAIRARKGE